MRTARDLHQEAMHLAAMAERARAVGNAAEARDMLKRAFDLERAAANEFAHRIDAEPTRGILHKSAAVLALDLMEWRQAEILISVGLAGNPPEYVAEELRNLLEGVHFSRHLLSREIVLAPYEIDLAVVGEAVGFGIADKEEILPRLDTLQTLLVRTAERISNRTFRKRGRPVAEVANLAHMYIQAPQARSLGFTIRVGSVQPALPGLGGAESVVTEVLQGLRAIAVGDERTLEALIRDEDYRRNFTMVARELLPDGRRIKAVNIAGSVGGERMDISLTNTRKSVKPIVPQTAGDSGEVVELIGELRLMDSRKETEVTHIRTADNREHSVVVPGEVMSEVLPIYYKHTVRLTVRRGPGGRFHYVDIERAED